MGQAAKHESSSQTQTQTQTDTGREVSSAGSDCPASFTVREGWTETPTCLPDTRKKFTMIFLSFRGESDQASCITSQFPLRIHHLFLRHNRITRYPSALQRVALPVTPDDSTAKQPLQGPSVLDRFSHQAHFSLCTHCNRSLTAYLGADWTGRVGDGCLGHAVMLRPPTGRRDGRQLQEKNGFLSWALVPHRRCPVPPAVIHGSQHDVTHKYRLGEFGFN
ncbi:hypothetical protein CEP53_014122 [Fusarium sp. AF-6]|nr:hypothetical protein CEP53_014122 [Fusarium sp. AF-6]